MSGSSSTTSGGLGARLEAKLDAATRRTQALADAVEESLAASSFSPAGLDGGGAGPLPLPLPTPLRSLVAQLLSVGGQQQQEQQQQQSLEEEDRPSAPVLVELRGAGLGQVNGLYRADAGPPPVQPGDETFVRYHRVTQGGEEEEKGASATTLELFLGPCGVCGVGSTSGATNNSSVCATVCDGCVRSWYVGDGGRGEVFYLASASAATAPPLLGWRVAVPHGVAPAPRLVYHDDAPPASEGEGEPEGAVGRSEVGSSVGDSTCSDAAFLAAASSSLAASSDGFACATAAAVEGKGGRGVADERPAKTAQAARAASRRRRRGRRVSSVVMEEDEGATETEMAAAAAAVAASASAAPLPPSLQPAPVAAAGADGTALGGEQEQKQEPMAAAAAPAPVSSGGEQEEEEEEEGLLPQLEALQGGYAAAVRALAEEERALRAAVRDAEARAAAGQGGDDSSGGEEEGEGTMPLSFEARLRALWQWQQEQQRREREERVEMGEQEDEKEEEEEEEGAPAPHPPVQQEGPMDDGAAAAEAGEGNAAATVAVADGTVGLLLSDDSISGYHAHPLAPLRVEVLGLERDDAPAPPRFLLRLTSLELPARPPPPPRGRGPRQPILLPIHRVRILRRPRAALLALHEQLAALPLPTPLPPFPASSSTAAASAAAEPTGGALRASFSLLAGGGGGSAQHQQQQRWEECRRVEVCLTALVRLVVEAENGGASPWPLPLRTAAAARLRAAFAFGAAEQAAGRADVIVRLLHTDPCPSVTGAERQALWAAQGGRCRGCGARLAQGQGVAARWPLLRLSRGEGEQQPPAPFMTCRYLRRLFCMGPACGGGCGGGGAGGEGAYHPQDTQQEPRAVLPGPALRGLDFRPRRISHLAAAYLDAVRAWPLVPLPLPAADGGEEGEGEGRHEGAAKARRALEYVATLCRQLGELARGCDGGCPAAARMLAEAGRPVPAPWQQRQVQGEDDGDAAARDACLSLDEVLALRDGRLTGRLIVAVEALDVHVVEQCPRCRAAAAKPCAFCEDATAPVFAHQFWTVARCGLCGALAHRACLRDSGGGGKGGGGGAGAGCPRCGAAMPLS